jgi:4-diphosphocytidyl-2-C-methyl-D-erythritol kinase
MQALLDVPAPAKLNLFLHVLGRRPDGYHLLQSAFVLIDWCDTLHFEKRSDGQLNRHDLGITLPEDDLCLRAARALQAASNSPWGCDISIDKKLPSGAGLGGGSSDAATTLLALNRLWGLNWSRAQLQTLALPLGADVPFFVGGRNALAEGIGELLQPLLLREHRLVVLKPDCDTPTSVIFNSPHLVRDNQAAILSGFLARDHLADNALMDATFNSPANSAAHSLLKGAGGSVQGKTPGSTRSKAGQTASLKAASDKVASDWPTDELFHGFGRNDLQRVAEAEFPQVAQAVRLLHQLFGNSRMTGSGSAVFATLDSSPGALSATSFDRAAGKKNELDDGADTAARAALSGVLPANWVARVCRSLPQHPLLGWAAD